MSEPMDVDIVSSDALATNHEHNSGPPRCPYRLSGDVPYPYSHMRHSQHLPFYPAQQQLNHFHSHNLRGPHWDQPVNLNYHTLQPSFASSLHSRYTTPFDHPNPAGRAPEVAPFDYYHTQGDGRQQSHPSAQLQQPRYQDYNSVPHLRRDFHPDNFNPSREGPVPSVSSSTHSTTPAVSSNYNTMSARSEASNTIPQENGQTASSGSGRVQLPPLQLDQINQQGMPAFLRDSNRIPTNQMSSSNYRRPWVYGHTLSREDSTPPHLTHNAPQPHHRTWREMANLDTPYGEWDSDESSDEGHIVTSTNARITGMPNSQGFEHRVFPYDDGAAIERARAARRARAAQFKLVASQTALSSFQKVELETLVGDERNCIICYNEFNVINPDGNIECPVRLPKCKHIFGDHCIKQWLKDSDSCPYCRDKLPSEPKSVHGTTHREAARARVDIPTTIWGPPSSENAHNARVREIERDMEREEHIQSMLQEHMLQHPHSRAQELLEAIERETELSHPSDFLNNQFGHIPRILPDHEGGRSSNRRYRGRHSLGRLPQAPIRPGGSNTTRNFRNHQQAPMRTPVHGASTSFDGGSTLQQRSITPHPTSLPSWQSSQAASQTTSSERPSSLPSERSPLGQANDSVQSDTQRPNNANLNTIGSVSRAVSHNDDSALARTASTRLWPIVPAIPGRLPSAESTTEMTQSRQLGYETALDAARSNTHRNQGTSPMPQQMQSSRPTPPQQADFHQEYFNANQYGGNVPSEPRQPGSQWPPRYSGEE